MWQARDVDVFDSIVGGTVFLAIVGGATFPA
jgi:hypothetical protein